MHHYEAGCFVHTFPIFRSVRWYACHACLCHPLAFYASLHACSHVHAWVLLASLSSILQHNEVMDIRSKPTFVPCEHHLLFSFLLICLFSCLLACMFAFLLSWLFVYLVACHVSCHMLCLPCLSCLYVLCLFHMLFASFPSIACLLVSCSCLCMYTYEARTHGARARSPRHKQKGRGCKLVDISQATMFNSFRGLASLIWLCTLLNPFPSSFLSLLDGLY